MLTGPALGAALKAAMDLKKVKQGAVAKEFGVSQPSVSEWIRFGRIDKRHIPHLVSYFSDVAGFEHWGLPASWSPDAALRNSDGTVTHFQLKHEFAGQQWPFPNLDPSEFDDLEEFERIEIQGQVRRLIKEIRESRSRTGVTGKPHGVRAAKGRR